MVSQTEERQARRRARGPGWLWVFVLLSLVVLVLAGCGGSSGVQLTLSRVLVPVTATSTALQQKTFAFADGTAFGVAGAAVTLVFGAFAGNRGAFALTSSGGTARGTVTIGSCDFSVAASTFPADQGPLTGRLIRIDPCQVDAVDGRLIARKAVTGASATSLPPPPPGVGNLPPMVTNPGPQSNAEGDVVSLAIAASDPDGDPLTFSATNLPPGLNPINPTTGPLPAPSPAGRQRAGRIA